MLFCQATAVFDRAGVGFDCDWMKWKFHGSCQHNGHLNTRVGTRQHCGALFHVLQSSEHTGPSKRAAGVHEQTWSPARRFVVVGPLSSFLSGLQFVVDSGVLDSGTNVGTSTPRCLVAVETAGVESKAQTINKRLPRIETSLSNFESTRYGRK